MTLLAVALFLATSAPKVSGSVEYSRRVTAAAEELFAAEKKAMKKWRDAGSLLDDDSEEPSDKVVYQDVVVLLQSALDADGLNAHARIVAADVLLMQADAGDGTYDLCTLLDARDQATFVIEHPAGASQVDVQKAKALIREIHAIPSSSITGTDSDCEDDEGSSGSSTVSTAR